MPSSTSSLGRYSSYSLYSSYPSYRTSASSSSYLNRTTSLDRSAYNAISGSSATSSLGSSGGPSSYYRYSGSKGISALPPRPSYSSISDTYRSSRSVRSSPIRSTYGNRISSDSTIGDRDAPSRYSFSSSSPSSSSSSARSRDYSLSRDSGYGSTYLSRDRSVDYATNGSAEPSRSRGSSAARRDSEAERDEDDLVKMRVSDRIRCYESWKKDPAEERLAQRRKRLGLSPATGDTGSSRSPKPTSSSSSSSSYRSHEDNRPNHAEENGNTEDSAADERRSSVTDLCRKYNTNLNITSNGSSGEDTAAEGVSGCSGGAGPSVAPKDPSSNLSPESPIDTKHTRSRLNSYKEDKEGGGAASGSPKREREKARESPPAKANKDLDSYKPTCASPDISSYDGTTPSTRSPSTYTLPFRSRDRRDRMKERIALRLSSDQDGESPPSRRRSPTGSSSESFSDSNGLVGLRNIGNTCFMNSITQCLSNTRCLLEYMLRENYTSDINTTLSTMKGELVRAFGSLLNEMWREGASGPINTGSFKAQIQRFAPVFIGYAQHDAQELLRKLLEGLHEDVNRVTVRPRPITEDIDETLDDHQKAMEAWKRYLRYDDSKVVDMFVGQLKSSLQCSLCGHRSVTFDPFWDLSLPIPSRAGQVKLTQCLDLFTKEEVLEGEESPTCSKCKERRKMTKSFSIQKFPKVLVLHLKRFSPHERWRGKLTCMVEFPLDSLDLSRYAGSASISSQYRLIGVANHSGTALSGHYTAYCRHPYLKTWHEYNDSRVSTISSNRVCSPEAYVLFYELNS